MLTWQRLSPCRWLSSDGHFIVKDTIIGYLLYQTVAEYEKQYGADYRSFKTLGDAKRYAPDTEPN